MLIDTPDTLDTIAAVASPHGGAARGIVRICGPDTPELCRQLFSPDSPQPNRSTRPARPGSAFRQTGAWQIGSGPAPPRLLRIQLHLWPNRSSYTGQPSAEIHTVGSPPVLQKLLEELLAHQAPRVRAARPGEFTLRAFLAGRIDLVQAEAVLGVIEAEDHAGLEVALRQLAGGLSEPLAQLRSQLIELLADLEAGLDFADEDIEFVSRTQRRTRLEELGETLATIRQQARSRMTSTGRHRILIAGLPNAGKSTLLNTLAHHDSAITSPQAGTTRDVVTADIQLEGLDLQLLDTAGWEATPETNDSASIDQLARQQRLEQLEHAQLVLWCLSNPEPGTSIETHLDQDRQARLEIQARGTPMLVLLSRCDLEVDGPSKLDDLGDPDDPDQETGETPLAVSAVTGQGMTELRQALVARLTHDDPGPATLVGSTAARTADALSRTSSRLRAAADVDDELLVAVEIREALDELGAVMGTVYTDEILDLVFSKFCIGK